MARARDKLLETIDHIKTLRLLLTFLAVIIVAQWFRIGHLQEVRRIYIPPDLAQGKLTSFDEVPPPVVYTFAYYILQQINRWKTNGEQDYPTQIYILQGFLTPGCIAALEEDMNTKKRLGELRNRVRMIQEIEKRNYTRSRVLIETSESWITWIDVNIQESISGHKVKDVNVRYKVPVVRFDVDREVNPWGLAVDCDEHTKPTILSEQDIEQPFEREEASK